MDFIPQIYWPGRNTKAMEVEVCQAFLYYSYTTLVGVRIPGKGSWRHEDSFSRTTNRHLGEWGLRYETEVSEEELQRIVNDHMVEYFQAKLREKFL